MGAYVGSFSQQGTRAATAPVPRAPVGFGKVPEITLGFWIIKIAATTLGETGGDAVTMSLGLGYAVGTLIFAALFAVVLAAELAADRFRPFLYWAVVVATTTVGTTLADFADRSLHIGYPGGTLLLAACLALSLAVWRWSEGAIAATAIRTRKVEVHYWVTILFSQTLGTALGDWTADGFGLGYGGGAVVFGAILAFAALLYLVTDLSRVALFWFAFIMTRPLGATVGDLLDKPVSHGGLALDRFTASGMLAAFIVLAVLLIPQRAGDHPGAKN